MSKKATKIVLYMEGGLIQDVHTDGPVEITIVDKEELLEYGLSAEERKSLFKKTIKGCKRTSSWCFVANPKA